MMDDLYKNLAQALLGYVESPAGCGKTEAIFRAVRDYSTGTQLILTHTNAGVAALKKRFRENNVPNEKYHIETISGWAWSWVRKYPMNSGYNVEGELPNNDDWRNIYIAATKLIKKTFVRYVINNSYTGVIVDEYQDCTRSMHNLIYELKNILPCRILGDPLQGIFGFDENDPLIDWDVVKRDFVNQLGQLAVPHRWKNSGNEQLGKWIIDNRNSFQENSFPDFDGSPIHSEHIDIQQFQSKLISIAKSTSGSICIIGPKHGNFQSAIITSLVNQGFKFIESNDLSRVKKLIKKLVANVDVKKKGESVFQFIEYCFCGLGQHKNFVHDILLGKSMRPKIQDRKNIYQKFNGGYEPKLILALIDYLYINEISCQRTDSVSCLTNILSTHINTGENLINIFNSEITSRRYSNQRLHKRVLGTTLLLKGLEFDHSVVLYDHKGWGNNKDLYVAVSRGSKSVRILQRT
ncbi:AAA family ATPase [Tatlockia micdadei]|uniref:UvrD-helicase domain-containing protein n=1 Tax=Legionella micdadei TaxID=451 RepID=UPI00156F1196|nr:UvrD-helicase domain-containing protein [Legionella micdadei]NSL19028.1 AAA family ATPase [Legionella micdadei]